MTYNGQIISLFILINNLVIILLILILVFYKTFLLRLMQRLVHEVGHNLGMQHDFVSCSSGKNCEAAYTGNCRRDVDGSHIPCTSCENYLPGIMSEYNTNLYSRKPGIGPTSGKADDCCNGFMGYGRSPDVWSSCSVRFFRSHYIGLNWAQCMDTGKLFAWGSWQYVQIFP